MVDQNPDSDFSLDLRHIGRVNDKEMPIEAAGMEMAKPGFADLRRRKYTVPLPGQEPDGAIDPLASIQLHLLLWYGMESIRTPPASWSR
jgi:hypothetical protein